MISRALLVTLALAAVPTPGRTQENPDLDARVQKFLDDHQSAWRDMNVPMSDGRALYDLIVKNGYTRALEIGTSTGHSAIWIAWALSKTGGKLITIEIDPGRHRQALAYFEEVGLSQYIDARLADAHDLVPALPGPFDFVFLDADKDWYPRYFRDALPNLVVDGCFVAHNVSDPTGAGRRRSRAMSGTDEFVQVLRNTPNMETTFISGGGGLSVSYKRGS